MFSGYACQRCSQLPPPPPMFAIGPPPNILSIEAHCSSRSLSIPSIENKKGTSSLSSIPIILGIIIAFLITLSTIVLIKKRQQRHRKKRDNTMMIGSSSVRYNRHHQHNNNNNNNHHHHHQNWTTCIPLLSDSCSSDQTSSTPPNEYPSCTNGVIEPLLTRDTQHEYEQIKCDDSSSGSLHYYCLVYCRQCANYHPTSSSSSTSSSSCPRLNPPVRSCYLPLPTNPTCQHQCSCHQRTYYQRNDNRFFELQPMLTTRIDNNSEDSNNHLKFIEETPPI